MTEPTETTETTEPEPCIGCGQPIDRALPHPIPDNYQCMWSEAVTGRALYCQTCYDTTDDQDGGPR